MQYQRLNYISRLTAGIMIVTSLTACSHFDQLADVGTTPTLSAIKNPVAEPGYRPVSLPMPAPQEAVFNDNSLWRNGSRAFFKDQRASRVGDILTVLIEITDKAELDNTTSRDRTGARSVGVDALAGYTSLLKKVLPTGADFSKLIDMNTSRKSSGAGSVDREEKIETKMAAVVVQELPNGNLVLEGRQEIRVNHEVREIIVAGIIRPEDISSENTVPISKIAEARVSYGGRGSIDNLQKQRYGEQVLDIVLPF